MSKCPMRGHFRYLRFKTFPMVSRTPQCEVFWVLLSSSEHSGVPEDSKSPTFPSVGLHPTLGQVRVATLNISCQMFLNHHGDPSKPIPLTNLVGLNICKKHLVSKTLKLNIINLERHSLTQEMLN
jgi:hypothetical protein